MTDPIAVDTPITVAAPIVVAPSGTVQLTPMADGVPSIAVNADNPGQLFGVTTGQDGPSGDILHWFYAADGKAPSEVTLPSGFDTSGLPQVKTEGNRPVEIVQNNGQSEFYDIDYDNGKFSTSQITQGDMIKWKFANLGESDSTAEATIKLSEAHNWTREKFGAESWNSKEFQESIKTIRAMQNVEKGDEEIKNSRWSRLQSQLSFGISGISELFKGIIASWEMTIKSRLADLAATKEANTQLYRMEALRREDDYRNNVLAKNIEGKRIDSSTQIQMNRNNNQVKQSAIKVNALAALFGRRGYSNGYLAS